jgi:hypothetical protein
VTADAAAVAAETRARCCWADGIAACHKQALWARWISIVFAALSLVLATAGARAGIPGVAAFFGSGVCLLMAALTALWARLASPAARRTPCARPRQAARLPHLAIRPAHRSCCLLDRSGNVPVISVESFRREGNGRRQAVRHGRLGWPRKGSPDLLQSQRHGRPRDAQPHRPA